jgi:hypothetical protein
VKYPQRQRHGVIAILEDVAQHLASIQKEMEGSVKKKVGMGSLFMGFEGAIDRFETLCKGAEGSSGVDAGESMEE